MNCPVCGRYTDSTNHRGITIVIEAVSLLQSTMEHELHVLNIEAVSLLQSTMEHELHVLNIQVLHLATVIHGWSSSTNVMTMPILQCMGHAHLLLLI